MNMKFLRNMVVFADNHYYARFPVALLGMTLLFLAFLYSLIKKLGVAIYEALVSFVNDNKDDTRRLTSCFVNLWKWMRNPNKKLEDLV